MFGLSIEKQAPVVRSAPNRVDIACFVGYAGRRGTEIPIEVDRWLTERWPQRLSQRSSPEVVASDPLPDPVTLDSGSNVMRLLLDGELHLLPLPMDEMTGEELVTELNTGLWKDAARLDHKDRLVLAAKDLTSLSVRKNPALGFPVDVTSHDLLDVPIPIDNWEIFDFLFAWDRRDIDGGGLTGSTYLGTAIRSYFAQGGRKCYVVCLGEPWSLTFSDGHRLDRIKERLERIVPGYPYRVSVSPIDTENLSGVGHIFTLPDVSFLCIPDLADVVALESDKIDPPEEPPLPEERFVDCSEGYKAPPKHNEARWFRAPRCDDVGYAAWSKCVGLILDLLSFYGSDVQLITALPIPKSGITADENILEQLVDQGRGPLARKPDSLGKGMSSEYLQLVYPWVRTPASGSLPERLESPDAVLAGILARNALLRGTYRSAAGMNLADVYDVFPSLRRNQILKTIQNSTRRDASAYSLLERVSLFGPTPDGLMLLSDVTTSMDETYRPACVRRLVLAIVRAARRMGEEMVFESSSETIWATVRDNLSDLLLGLFETGALRGESARDAFQVRCDRSTMTQSDIDNGRIIAQLWFNPSTVVEKIKVILSMHEGGSVSLISSELTQAEVTT